MTRAMTIMMESGPTTLISPNLSLSIVYNIGARAAEYKVALSLEARGAILNHAAQCLLADSV